MNLALDTNRYSDLCNREPTIAHLAATADRIVMPVIVLAELRAGFAAGSKTASNEADLLRFLNAPGVEVVCADDQTTFHYAHLFAQLRRQGTKIPTNDLWIAALVVQHGLVLASRDRHFDRLPQLARA